MKRKLAIAAKILFFTGLLILFIFMIAPSTSEHRRIVTIEQWTEQIRLVTFETRYWHLRSWNAIWWDLSNTHELCLTTEDVGWRGTFWVRGNGEPLSQGGNRYRIGRDAWPIRWGDYCVPEAFLGFVLDEPGKISWGEMDKDLSSGKPEQWLAIRAYEESRRAATFFVKTNAQPVHVASWDEYLRLTGTREIRVYWGDEYFDTETPVRLRVLMVSPTDAADGMARIDLAGHILRADLSHAFREDVAVLGRQSETPGKTYDLWGYFNTADRTEPPEQAHFKAILVLPADGSVSHTNVIAETTLNTKH